MNTFIIAEVATTWLIDEPSIIAFNQLVGRCAQAAVQAVKVQWVSDPHKMEMRRNFPPFTYSYLNWPQHWMKEMAQVCADNGVEWMCTAYLPDDVAIIDPYVKRHKIASLESKDRTLIERCGHTGKPIMISTGAMARTDYVSHWRRGEWASRVELMHAVAAYPAPALALNLLAIGKLFGTTGFSDHSADMRTGMVAVACGARYLEVHVRHDLTPPGNSDYGHSLTIEQLKVYVDNVRWAERALGDGVKKVEACEEALRAHRVIA